MLYIKSVYHIHTNLGYSSTWTHAHTHTLTNTFRVHFFVYTTHSHLAGFSNSSTLLLTRIYDYIQHRPPPPQPMAHTIFGIVYSFCGCIQQYNKPHAIYYAFAIVEINSWLLCNAA